MWLLCSFSRVFRALPKLDNLFSFSDTIGFFQKTTKVFVKTVIPNSLDAITVCLRVYSFGQRSQMYFMSYATKSGEKFAFYKYASTLGARVGTVRRQ